MTVYVLIDHLYENRICGIYTNRLIAEKVRHTYGWYDKMSVDEYQVNED